MQASPEVKIYKANKMLQAKVGTGTVNKKIMYECQLEIDNNNTDFEPMAKNFLKDMKEVIDLAKTKSNNLEELQKKLSIPVMHLKANASIFGYNLVGELASIMLGFLESYTSIDDDIITIVEAHHKTLSAIIKNKIKGDGGETGTALKNELEKACRRYQSKQNYAIKM